MFLAEFLHGICVSSLVCVDFAGYVFLHGPVLRSAFCPVPTTSDIVCDDHKQKDKNKTKNNIRLLKFPEKTNPVAIDSLTRKKR